MAFYKNTPYGVQYYQPTGFMPAQPSYHPLFGYSGGWQFSGGGGYTPPSTTPVASNIVSSYGLQDVGEGMYYYPTADKYFSGEKFYTKSENQYSPYEEDIKGFNRASETGIYSPSQVYMSYLNRTPYQQYTGGYNPNLNINSSPTNLYTQSTGSLLSAPSSMPSYSGNYGANRFLNTGNLLGFNFTPAQTTASVSPSGAVANP